MARRFDCFDLALLHVFCVICDKKGLTKAATELGLTNAGVTMMMNRLEATCGRELFERNVSGTRRGTHLTPAGAAFLPKVKALLAIADEARASLEL